MRSMLIILLTISSAAASDPILISRPDAFPTLVNPNCSHCVDEAKRRADELKPDDPVLAWTRGYSEGGVIPIRFFLNRYRVISDSYGVFVYDPEAGYARGFAPSYKFTFHGWRNGIMVMKHADGTLYSCLSGRAFAGPRSGDQLEVVPTLTHHWGPWTKRYPDAVAYHMFEKYQPSELPVQSEEDSLKSRLAKADSRLPAEERVLGIRTGNAVTAIPLASLAKQQLRLEKLVDNPIVILHDPAVPGAVVAFRPVASQPRKYRGPQPNADGISPPNPGTPLPDGKVLPSRTLSFMINPAGQIQDQETSTVWDLAGRGVTGPLQGWTLEPVDAVVCKWFAWSSEFPETAISRAETNKPVQKPAPKKVADPAKTMKEVAGAAEFLRVLPKPFATIKAIDPTARTVTLLLEGEKVAKSWALEPDAELKVKGFWGRLEQFKVGDRVWVWLKLNRSRSPVSIAMMADMISTQEIRENPDEPIAKPQFSASEIESQRGSQRTWLRERWLQDGLPGTVTFQHVFSGEVELMLDHEAMRWGRSLTRGAKVQLLAEPAIQAVVKQVTPWRERTLVRLVVGELESSDLKPGMRIGLKMPALAQAIDESPYPPDLGRPRSPEEREDWFLASIYCVCGINGNICTGQFYTLASCNPNGCGSPGALRREVRELMAQGKTDKEIWDHLRADRGPLMVRPHLLP